MSNPNNNPYDSTGNSGNYGDNQQPYGEQPSGDSYGAGDYGSGSGLPSYGSGAQQGPAGSQPGGYQQGAGGYQEPNIGSYEQYQGYQGGGFDDAPVKKSGLALAAFIIGIISLLATITGFSIVPGLVGIIVAIIALVVNRKKPKEARRTWMSVLGLIFSIIGVIATVLLFGIVLAIFGDPAVQACWDNAATQVEFQECFEGLVQ
ncbi:MAG: DUF4190 domain-containing protein [Corynebacterium casei]|uniref:DUF4190 domain-containing protein n=1 Tax=Corynebacterium casei TaxID=160386 RepID=UPI003F8DC0FF